MGRVLAVNLFLALQTIPRHDSIPMVVRPAQFNELYLKYSGSDILTAV
jgi:hypothetical protein